VWKSSGAVKLEAEIFGLNPALWPDSIGCFTGTSQGVSANFYSYSSGVVTYLVGASHQIYFNSSGVIYSGAYGACAAGQTMSNLIAAGLTTN
jgi:hypothetical protein